MAGERTMECRICGSDLDDAKNVVSCGLCHAAFHRDCWFFNGGCGIYGCGSRTYVAFQPTETKGIVLDEHTRLPVTAEPRVQAMIRFLPRWGKLLIPSVLPGLAATLLVVILYPVIAGKTPGTVLIAHLALCGLLPGVFAPPLGRTLRRSPTTVFAAALAVSVALYVAGRSYNIMRMTMLALSVVSASVASNALVERLTAPYRLAAPPWPLLMTFLRPVLTGIFLLLLLVGLTFAFDPRPLLPLIDELLVIGLFGLFVAAPPMELSKSAKYRKLVADSLKGS